MDEEMKDYVDPKKTITKESVPTIIDLMGLFMMWKILTAQFRKETNKRLLTCGLFPEEQKGYRKLDYSLSQNMEIWRMEFTVGGKTYLR